MGNFRFIHAADIHLDSPLHGLSRYQGLPVEEVRGAPRAAFDNLVERAIDEGVDFVVIAGDLFDGDWKDMNTGLYFAAAMGRLNRAGISVFILFGNHDAASVLTRSVPWPANVHLFSSCKPETRVMEELGVALHGQSFANAATMENLAAAYPARIENVFNIGILHTALTGREDHAGYAPCSLDDLRARGYDYWALGHAHGFEIACTDPHVVFPGNIQGRSIRETGARGAVLVEVVDREIASITRIELDVMRWSAIEVDCTDATSEDLMTRIRTALADAHAAAATRHPLIARVTLTGETGEAGAIRERETSLRDDVRAIASALSAEFWIEKVKVRLREPEQGGGLGLSDDLAALIAETASSEDLAGVLREDLAPFIASVRASLGETAEDDELRRAAGNNDWPHLMELAAMTLRARLAGGT